MIERRLVLEDGKYTLVASPGKLHCLRYGEEWRDLIGDKMVHAMLDEIERLRALDTLASPDLLQEHWNDGYDDAKRNPIDMVLHCTACGMQHIDRPDTPEDGADWKDPEIAWTNPPHRSHLCHGCGHIWRPADVHTNGVEAIRSRGVNDSPIVKRFK